MSTGIVKRVKNIQRSKQNVATQNPSIENITKMHQDMSSKFSAVNASMKEEESRSIELKDFVLAWNTRKELATAKKDEASKQEDTKASRYFNDLAEAAERYREMYDNLMVESQTRLATLTQHSHKMHLVITNLKNAEATHNLQNKMRALKKASYLPVASGMEANVDVREINSLIHTAEALIEITRGS